jgi:hypothetical protein
VSSRTPIGAAVALATIFSLAAGRAGATSLTLDPQGDFAVPVGTIIEVLFGLDDITEVQAYTVDIEYDNTELLFLSAEPLGSTEVAAGLFAAKAFTLDPTADLTSGTSGRASVLLVPPDELFLDGRTNIPGADTREGFFALEFQVLNVFADSLADLTIGILNSQADDISKVGGGSLIPDLTSTSVSLNIVPEPRTGTLVLLALASLSAWRRRRASR